MVKIESGKSEIESGNYIHLLPDMIQIKQIE